jgi:ATP-dependent NAD(P)H-hydrate dehydratase
VIGCGLGRDELLTDYIAWKILNAAIGADKLVIVDADGINLLCRRPLDHGYRPALILTPNMVEFGRLWAAYMPDTPCPVTSLTINASYEQIDPAVAVGPILLA